MTPGREQRHEIKDAASFGRVAVMLGGDSSERDVSLDSGQAVLTALCSRGIDAHAWDPADNSLEDFAGADFDRVWIALHGPGGEDGSLQGALQWLGIAYTGSGVMASALAMDKLRSKNIFRAARIDTPDFQLIGNVQDARLAASTFGYPLVLKPISEGSSVGMSKVMDASELKGAVELVLKHGESAIAERCIVGEELTVAVLQGKALPSIRIETPRPFYDYRAKYVSDNTQYHCPGTAGAKQEQRLANLATAAYNEIGCSGWGRVDFMVGEDDRPQVLEVNTVPGMTSHSLVPMAANSAGIDFAELCWRILETSFAQRLVPATPANHAGQSMGAIVNGT